MENKAYDQVDAKSMCQAHMYRYVMVQTNDGCCVDGFVEHVDDEHVYLAVPHCLGDWERAFLPYGGYGGFGGGFGYPFYPPRRFYRRAFPLGSLLAISLLPFFL
ncbi:hypothetical protein [Paenibacillus sp. PAMC21692]|uniref:hypothetical protein n=1 Tax=Paenibacillus sp. PAMC21692 TaxID=2762320 RepID=UPI00164E15CA|nr:hypothetical protein [Paenibacillus sp. PAMC21692]QNK55519.1 hypothetical protein H7F31_23320 [Paenibacillus sp. PAMC21692]